MKENIYACVALISFVLIAESIFAAGPSSPASNVTFGSIDGGSVRVSWTNGNGAKRIVIARQGQAVTATPANGTDYLANGTFGNGFEIQPGQFVVANTSSFLVDLSGLQPNTTYHFAVFEFNGTGATTEYNTTAAVGNTSTLKAPTVQASNVTFTNVTGNSIKINWTNGNGNARIVLVKQAAAVDANPVDLTYYNSTASFGAGTSIGTGNYVIYNAVSNSATVTDLLPNTTYYVAVFEENGSFTPVYLTTSPARNSITTLARPTVPANSLTTSQPEGNSMRVSWNTGNGTRRIVVARAGQPVDAIPADGVDYLPGTSSPFNTAPEISSGQKVVYDGTSFLVDLSGLSASTTYYFRVYEYDGTGSSIGYLTSSFANGSGSTVAAPTTQSSGITFTNITGTSMKVNWVNGNGSYRIVLAKANGPVDATPADFNYYGANYFFGSGTQIGNGNYVLYYGNGNNTPVESLTSNTTYHFAIFEANGFFAPVFLTSSPAVSSQTTIARPTVPSSTMAISSIDGGSMRLTWTPGNGAKRIVVARANQPVDAIPDDGVDYLPTITSPFNTAPEISSGQKVVYNSNSSIFDITGLTPGTTYYFRVYEYDGSGSSIKYLTSASLSGNGSTLSAPSTQASGLTISNITNTSLQLNWVNGNGSGRIVLAKAVSAVDAVPADLSYYSPNSAFGAGTAITPGNYVVFSSAGNSITITNLNQSTTYHFAVFEFNGSFSPVYLTANPARISVATTGQPTVPSSGLGFTQIEGNSMKLTWTPGNGARRLVVARAGQQPDALPVNGTAYTAGSNFSTAPEISPGQKIVFDNTNSSFDLTGLTPNTVYYFKVFEYTGSGATTGYLTSSFGSGNSSTAKDPNLPSNTVAFTSVTGTSAQVSWSNGNGEGRLVVMRQGAAVNGDPADLSDYAANSIFGSGAQIGSGNFAVYKSIGSSVTVTGLQTGTTYYVTVYEYNGSSAPMYLTPGSSGQVTTVGAPKTQASNAGTSAITRHSVQLNWTNGSGNRRIVLMKQGSAVNQSPVNNVHYTANTFFGSGTELGIGNFVVFDGTQNTVTVTNLQQGSNYFFSVFEYNDFGSTTQVLTLNPATGNLTAVNLPVTLTYFKGVVETGQVKLSWQTAQEQNSDYFAIEKSNNGVNFYEIGKVTAKGESSIPSNYSFPDRSPFEGNNYYRLRQVDKDGSKEYSSLVYLKFNSKKLLSKMIDPVATRLVADLSSQPASNDYLLIVDTGGRIIKKERLSRTHVDTDVSTLAPGLYLLEIHTQLKTESIKFLKQ